MTADTVMMTSGVVSCGEILKNLFSWISTGSLSGAIACCATSMCCSHRRDSLCADASGHVSTSGQIVKDHTSQQTWQRLALLSRPRWQLGAHVPAALPQQPYQPSLFHPPACTIFDMTPVSCQSLVVQAAWRLCKGLQCEGRMKLIRAT